MGESNARRRNSPRGKCAQIGNNDFVRCGGFFDGQYFRSGVHSATGNAVFERYTRRRRSISELKSAAVGQRPTVLIIEEMLAGSDGVGALGAAIRVVEGDGSGCSG